MSFVKISFSNNPEQVRQHLSPSPAGQPGPEGAGALREARCRRERVHTQRAAFPRVQDCECRGTRPGAHAWCTRVLCVGGLHTRRTWERVVRTGRSRLWRSGWSCVRVSWTAQQESALRCGPQGRAGGAPQLPEVELCREDAGVKGKFCFTDARSWSLGIYRQRGGRQAGERRS